LFFDLQCLYDDVLYYVIMQPSRNVRAYVKNLISKNPVVLDTETTGLGDRDTIIEIAVIDMRGNTIVDTLVNPTQPIPPGATRIHGIKDRDLQDAPTFDIVWLGELEDIFKRRIVCAYNVDFDLRMIRQSLKLYGIPFPRSVNTECIMKLFAEMRGEWDFRRNHHKWYKLGEAAKILGITIEKTPHRALADAILAKEILLRMSSD